MSSIRYRPDIDGLRAIAVLGVVVFHAFPKALPGGFCGVDIFFVISGYLISGILYRGVQGGGFSFRDFYARRIRRIFPSLITVMLLCLGYGYFVLLSDEYQQLGKHVAAGTVFIQNFVFWQESGYWDVASTLKPLLHLWSLAVEEQFYIIFPPLLLLFWKRKWPMVPLLWILLAVSLIANLVMSTQDRSSDFYLTSYRAWEFLGGSLLAWWHYGKNHEEEAPYGNTLALLGLILLAASMILLKEKEPYPGWRAIFPVVGSVALIAAGKQSWVNRVILSNPLVVWIGLISYPLYLFHWPALSFVHIIKGEKPDTVFLWAALGVAFLLTLITYFLVERPVRFSKSKNTVAVLSGIFIITGLLGVLVWRGGINPKVTPEVNKVGKALLDRDFYAGLKQHESPVGYFTVGGEGPQTLFLGDSNMEQYEPRIAKLLKDNTGNSRGAIFITCGGIPPIPGYQVYQRPEGRKLIPVFQEIIKKDMRVDRVVIAACWPVYFKSKNHLNTMNRIPIDDPHAAHQAVDSLGKMVSRLVDDGKKVTIVLGAPVGLKLEPRNSISRTFVGMKYTPNMSYSKDEFLEGTKQLFELIRTAASKNGAEVIDPLDYLCKNGICISENEDGPIRYNNVHLRPGFVRDHVTYLDETVAP
jgi:peptidoglycan/LPS O-acetylase OafA/YrhL